MRALVVGVALARDNETRPRRQSIMKTTQLKWTAALLALAATNALAATSEPKAPTLKVGDPAPKLQNGKWVQGQPVKDFQKGKAYIVEFWATWCGPCRVSIPHLNEIHEKYKEKGLIVIGQDCWERDEKLVEPFIKKMGDKMTYRVALDDKTDKESGAVAETWMAAAGRNGIPSAFLVDTKGVIAWIGHPMQLKESVIEAVLDGTFDVKKAAADYEKQQRSETALRTVWRELSKAMASKDWDAAEAKVKQAEQLLPEDERDGLSMTRFNIAVNKGDYQAAYRCAEKASDGNKDNAMLQNQLAWQMLTDPKIKERDLGLAEKIATRANDAAQGKDPAILDTLARACFMNGKKEQAIELQEKAVKLADGDMKGSLQEVLDSYKQGKLPKGE